MQSGKQFLLILISILILKLSADDHGDWGGHSHSDHHHRSVTQSTSGRGSNDDVPLKIVIFLGSVREGRNVVRVSKYIKKKLIDTGHDVEIIDPEIDDVPLLKRPLHFYATRNSASSMLRRLNDRVKTADAYVILTAEYNRQMPPALINLIDHLPPISFAFKISGIVAYSTGAGGLMAAAQARGLMCEMGAPPIPFILHIPQVDKYLDENGIVKWNEAHLNKQMSKFILQLDWFSTALRRHTDHAGLPNWNGSVVSV